MKAYIEVSVVSHYKSPLRLVQALKKFATSTKGWGFLDERSKDYSLMIGGPSCMLFWKHGKHSAAVAITRKKNNTFYVSNIIPKNADSMSMDEYNRISERFAVDFREYVQDMRVKAKVYITNEEIDLSDIIRGAKSRRLFERYLSMYPVSYHPNDIKRLDIFTCAVSRYSKKRLKLELLARWLIEEKKWSQKDASWCIQRIEVGLDVLEANRNL